METIESLKTSEIYKEWVDGCNVISELEDKHGTIRVAIEDDGTYRLLRFFKLTENKWVVSCDVEEHEARMFISKLMYLMNREIN